MEDGSSLCRLRRLDAENEGAGWQAPLILAQLWWFMDKNPFAWNENKCGIGKEVVGYKWLVFNIQFSSLQQFKFEFEFKCKFYFLLRNT